MYLTGSTYVLFSIRCICTCYEVYLYFIINRNDLFKNGSTLFGQGDPEDIPDYYSTTGAVKLPKTDERVRLSGSERTMMLKFWDRNDDTRKHLKARYDAEMKRKSRNNRTPFEIWVPRGAPLTPLEREVQKGPPTFMNVYDTCTLNALLFRCMHVDDVQPDGSQNSGIAVEWQRDDGSGGLDFGMIQSIVQTSAYRGAELTMLLKVQWFRNVISGTICIC